MKVCHPRISASRRRIWSLIRHEIVVVRGGNDGFTGVQMNLVAAEEGMRLKFHEIDPERQGQVHRLSTKGHPAYHRRRP